MATIGRPPKDPADRYLTPARQIGRVSDDDWNTILRAVDATGQTKTEWAVSTLLRAARRVLQTKGNVAKCDVQTKVDGQS
jgi:hypothetical protein